MYYLGVDLGGTNIKAALVDADGAIIKEASTPTKLPRPAEAVCDDIAALCNQLAQGQQVAGIGVGCPGTVDGGIVRYSNNLDWHDFAIGDYLRAKTGLPVALANDANAAAFGEALAGCAKGAESAVIITLGTGVGAGIVIDGKIYSGSNFGGAEVGHTVISVDGPQCTCGRKGCFEVYSSATGLVRMTKEALAANPESAMKDEERISARTAFNYMRAGDATAKQVVDDYIKYLAAGITNTINIFQPDILCIGGGVCNEGDPLLVPMKEIVKKEVYTRNSAKNTEIVIAKLGNDAGIIGAAFLGNAHD